MEKRDINMPSLTPEAIGILNALARVLIEGNKAEIKSSDLQQQLLLSKFTDEILEYYKKQRSASSYKTLKLALQHLMNFLGNIYLNAITSKKLDGFYIYLSKRAPKGFYVYHRTLKAAFNKAFTWGYITKNPFASITLPKRQETELVTIDRDELNRILLVTKRPLFRDLFLFAFLTGLRLSELTLLQWSAVDLNEKIIRVGGEELITKNRRIRYVPLCNEAVEILLRVKPKIFRLNGENRYVFCKANGFPFTKGYISKQFKKAVLVSGVNPNIHFHSLRHGYATELVRNGVAIYKVRLLLGHSDVTTTQIYANLNIEDLRNAVSVLDKI